MSKMSNLHAGSAADRADDAERKVERLQEIISLAADHLNRGEPFRVLGQIEEALRDSRLELEADQLAEFQSALRAAMALLAP